MPELSLLLPMVAMLLMIGAFAGVLAGLLGVGGGIILVPAFFYAFSVLGYDSPQLMQICLATSLATIIVTSLRSVAAHHAKGAVEWSILKGWGVGIALGAFAGVAVASALRSEVLQIIFSGLAMLIGLYLAFGKVHWRLGEEMPRGALRIVGSPLVGFLSVLLGIGGGSFGVPIMTAFGVPIHRAIATAAGFGVLIALPAVAAFVFSDVAITPPGTIGAVNLPAFGLVIAMTLLTAPIGVRLAHRTDAKLLKRVFGGFVILVALNMLRKVIMG